MQEPRPRYGYIYSESLHTIYTFIAQSCTKSSCDQRITDGADTIQNLFSISKELKLKLISEIHDVLNFTSRRKFTELILVCKFLLDVLKF